MEDKKPEDIFLIEGDNHLIMSDPLPTDSLIMFHYRDGSELMKFCYNGEIYLKGKLVTTDQEVVDGLRDIIMYFRCTKCKESLSA